MATPPQKKEDDQHQQEAANPSAPAVGLSGMVVDRYRKMKEHAEAYPYVWGSYIVVYGGFGLWFAYRFRKLRKTEDRVRVLQERLRKLVENEQQPPPLPLPPPSSSSSAASVAKKAPPPPAVDKTPK